MDKRIPNHLGYTSEERGFGSMSIFVEPVLLPIVFFVYFCGCKVFKCNALTFYWGGFAGAFEVNIMANIIIFACS